MLTKLLSASAAAFMAMSGPLHAQQPLPKSSGFYDANLLTRALAFDHPEAVWTERRPLGPLLAIVVEFLAEQVEVPRPERPPVIRFVSASHISAVRYRDISPNPEQISFATRVNALDMFYDRVSKTIYLSEHWTAGSPAEISVLVRAMINHAQSETGASYACAQDHERTAFAAQDAWLQLFGQNVQQALGMDGAAFMLATECIP